MDKQELRDTLKRMKQIESKQVLVKLYLYWDNINFYSNYLHLFSKESDIPMSYFNNFSTFESNKITDYTLKTKIGNIFYNNFYKNYLKEVDAREISNHSLDKDLFKNGLYCELEFE